MKNLRYIFFLLMVSCIGDNDQEDTYTIEIETLEQACFSLLRINDNLNVQIKVSIQNNGMLPDEVHLMELSDSIIEKRMFASAPYRAGLDPDKFLFSEDLVKVANYISYLTGISDEWQPSEQVNPILSRARFYVTSIKDEPNYKDHLLMSLNLIEAEQVILRTIKESIRAYG